MANENSKWKHPDCLKRGKTRATKSWLVLVWYSIGREGRAFFGPTTERSEAKPIFGFLSIENLSIIKV